MFEKFIDLLISTWVWGATWGFFHIFLNIVLMIILLKFVGRLKIVPAVLLSLFSELFAVFVYTGLVFILVFLLNTKFLVQDFGYSTQAINSLLACISIGLIGSFFQTIFFIVLNRFYSINLRVTILISFLSNIVVALLMYKFLDIN